MRLVDLAGRATEENGVDAPQEEAWGVEGRAQEVDGGKEGAGEGQPQADAPQWMGAEMVGEAVWSNAERSRGLLLVLGAWPWC